MNVNQLDIDSPDSIAVVVNKGRRLSDPLYVPHDLHDCGGVLLRFEAAVEFRQLSGDAASCRVSIVGVDGYRSADDQAHIYASYVSSYGASIADRITARPGHSEHQTGLAVDIGNRDGSFALSPSFDATPAGSWMAANAHRYGFTLRYPFEHERVTGFAYEPWHFRFVGHQLALELYESGLALEGFLGLPRLSS